jgi:hypothetical protein
VFLVVKLLLKFSLTIPSETAKNTKTWEMKWHAVLENLTQSARFAKRSTSSAVQKEALAFVYIHQTSA